MLRLYLIIIVLKVQLEKSTRSKIYLTTLENNLLSVFMCWRSVKNFSEKTYYQDAKSFVMSFI